MDIIGLAEVREAHVARGDTECYIMLRELPQEHRALATVH